MARGMPNRIKVVDEQILGRHMQERNKAFKLPQYNLRVQSRHSRSTYRMNNKTSESNENRSFQYDKQFYEFQYNWYIYIYKDT
jgi:hypothetical protein